MPTQHKACTVTHSYPSFNQVSVRQSHTKAVHHTADPVPGPQNSPAVWAQGQEARQQQGPAPTWRAPR